MDLLQGLPVAEPWSLTAGNIGRGSVQAAIGLYSLAALAWLLPKRSELLDKVAGSSFFLGSLGLIAAIITLGTLFLRNQFQYQYIFNHSDADIPVYYKVAAIWTAQQGSFLLWGVSSAIFGLLSLKGTGDYRRWYGFAYAIFLASISGILAYESPFNIMKDVMQDGKVFVPPIGDGMTPSLQNYWVVVHPPVIFLGFGALTVPFAYAVAAMLSGDVKSWAKQVRPWSLATLAILGLGLCMGGLWAYETQGWGGFWAWDPVENVSLVPWLLVATLTHGLIVQAAKGKWIASNLLLSGLPFISFVYGTFLTRSGLLDKVSVHSFASMDKSALVILRTFLAILAAAFAVLFVARGLKLAKAAEAATPMKESASGIDRESTYRFGMLLLSMLAVVVALGMSWPVITAVRGGQGARVEEFLYHLVVVWFFIPLMVMMAVAPFLGWKPSSLKEVWARVGNQLVFSVGLTGFVFVGLQNDEWGVVGLGGKMLHGPLNSKLPLLPVMALLIFLCVFVALTGSWRAIELGRKAGLSLGGFVAHFGLAMLLGGLILSRGFERKQQEMIQEGSPVQMLGYQVAFTGIKAKDLFDRDGQATFTMTDAKGGVTKVTPGLYYYEQGQELKSQVWPFVVVKPTHDIYFALHSPITDVWEKPISIKPGETKTADGVKLTYVGQSRTGQPGMSGTKFISEMQIEVQETATKFGKYTIRPYLELGADGVKPSITPVGTQFFAVLGRMDASDRSVELRLLFQRPLYPVELFIKPMTLLVWFGTGILTLGGLMSAFARRSRRKRAPVAEATDVVPQGI